jgi:DnaJ-class molecular chaperone
MVVKGSARETLGSPKKGLVTVRCAFCNGEGKDPFELLSKEAVCEVCGGRGEVAVAEPVHRCAFCEGSGVFPGSRLTCTSCMGRGVVTISGPAEVCPTCEGAGVLSAHTLPCSTCGGKGLVTVARPLSRSVSAVNGSGAR